MGIVISRASWLSGSWAQGQGYHDWNIFYHVRSNPSQPKNLFTILLLNVKVIYYIAVTGFLFCFFIHMTICHEIPQFSVCPHKVVFVRGDLYLFSCFVLFVVLVRTGTDHLIFREEREQGLVVFFSQMFFRWPDLFFFGQEKKMYLF